MLHKSIWERARWKCLNRGGPLTLITRKMIGWLFFVPYSKLANRIPPLPVELVGNEACLQPTPDRRHCWTKLFPEQTEGFLRRILEISDLKSLQSSSPARSVRFWRPPHYVVRERMVAAEVCFRSTVWRGVMRLLGNDCYRSRWEPVICDMMSRPVSLIFSNRSLISFT